MFRRTLLTSAAALLLFLLSFSTLGCGAQASDSYKVGALFAVTGFNSPLGTPEKESVKMLEEQINAKGGIKGHKLEVIVYDTESDETKALTLAKKLIEQDKVLAIIGPSSTGESLALVDTVQKAQIPLVSAAASATIVDPKNTWVFKTPQSDELVVSALCDYLKAKGLTKVALLTSSGGFGTTGKAALDKATPRAGIQVVAAESFGDTDTDMSVQLTKIKGTDAQALVVWGTNPGPALISKAAKQMGIAIPIFDSHGIANQKFIELAGEAANGVVFPAGKLLVAESLPDSDPQKSLLLSFGKEFQAKYNKAADTFGGHGYDSLNLVVRALEKVGPDKAKIRDELENTKDFVGVGGVFNMSPQDHNGLDERALAMIRIANGKWTLEK